MRHCHAGSVSGGVDRGPSAAVQENAGTSLVEAFSLEEIEQHMKMLEISGVNSKHSPFEFPDDSVCKACSRNRLTFEPPSLYCTCCGQRIRRNQVGGTPSLPPAAQLCGCSRSLVHAGLPCSNIFRNKPSDAVIVALE